MRVLRGFFVIAVLVCVAASATFAFEFGWTRGATEVHCWTYALAGIALDLVKCGLPILGATAWHGRELARAAACWIVFLVLTGLSLWCAYGITATQLAERFSDKAVAVLAKQSRETALDDLRAQRSALPNVPPMSEDGVRVAQAAADAAAAQRAAECGERGRPGPICREREADERAANAALLKAQSDKAVTDSANALDAKISAAQAAFNAVDVKAAVKEADPQSASMAKASGLSADLIAAISHAVFAIAIELGSGVGLWLVFGHGVRARRDDVERFTLPSPAVTALNAPMIEAPADVIERFFLQVVRATVGTRVASSAMMSAYEAWCADRGFEPVSVAMFGRLAPWRKERIGGRIWYLDATLAEGYAECSPRVIVDNSVQQLKGAPRHARLEAG